MGDWAGDGPADWAIWSPPHVPALARSLQRMGSGRDTRLAAAGARRARAIERAWEVTVTPHRTPPLTPPFNPPFNPSLYPPL